MTRDHNCPTCGRGGFLEPLSCQECNRLAAEVERLHMEHSDNAAKMMASESEALADLAALRECLTKAKSDADTFRAGYERDIRAKALEDAATIVEGADGLNWSEAALAAGIRALLPTPALQNPGGARYDEVPGLITALREQLAEARQGIVDLDATKRHLIKEFGRVAEERDEARAKALEEAAKALENNACRHAELLGYQDPKHCAESMAYFRCADMVRALLPTPEPDTCPDCDTIPCQCGRSSAPAPEEFCVGSPYDEGEGRQPTAPKLTPETVREYIARSGKDSADLDAHLRQTFTAPDNDTVLDSCGYPRKAKP